VNGIYGMEWNLSLSEELTELLMFIWQNFVHCSIFNILHINTVEFRSVLNDTISRM